MIRRTAACGMEEVNAFHEGIAHILHRHDLDPGCGADVILHIISVRSSICSTFVIFIIGTTVVSSPSFCLLQLFCPDQRICGVLKRRNNRDTEPAQNAARRKIRAASFSLAASQISSTVCC